MLYYYMLLYGYIVIYISKDADILDNSRKEEDYADQYTEYILDEYIPYPEGLEPVPARCGTFGRAA